MGDYFELDLQQQQQKQQSTTTIDGINDLLLANENHIDDNDDDDDNDFDNFEDNKKKIIQEDDESIQSDNGNKYPYAPLSIVRHLWRQVIIQYFKFNDTAEIDLDNKIEKMLKEIEVALLSQNNNKINFFKVTEIHDLFDSSISYSSQQQQQQQNNNNNNDQLKNN